MKLGEYEGNTIQLGDCIEGMSKLPSECVDLIVTDPPYLIEYKTNHRKDKTHKFCTTIKNDNNEQLIKDYIKECYRILKPNSAIYMFCNCNKIDFFKQEVEKYFNIKNIIVWVKNNWTAGDLDAQFGKQYEFIILANKGRKPFNGDRLTDVWYFDRVSGNNQYHQNQKPLDLIKLCIEKHSQTNDVVFDGFMGSGTTAVACIQLNRHFFGFEIDSEEFKLANDRIQGITPNERKQLEQGQANIFDFL